MINRWLATLQSTVDDVDGCSHMTDLDRNAEGIQMG